MSVSSIRHIVAALFAVWLLAAPSGASAAGSPALRITPVAGYRIAVAGKGWPHSRLVAVTLHASSWIVGVEVRTTQTGAFEIGANQVDLCGGVWFEARDTAGHDVIARGPALMCPSQSNPPRPSIRRVQGSRANSRRMNLLAPTAGQAVTLHLGDRLSLWEPGTAAPAFTPRADDRYLALLSETPVPQPSCTGTNCQAGFQWVWVAIRVGQTGIDLSPACRQSHPACGMPDFLMEVDIVP